MRKTLRRVFIVSALGIVVAAIAAGAGMAKPGDHPDHPATAASGSNGNGNANGQASAPGQAAPAAPSDEGSTPSTSTAPAATPPAPATTSSDSQSHGGSARDDRDSKAAPAQPGPISVQQRGNGPSSPSDGRGNKTAHGPGSGVIDTSHVLGSLEKRIERLATQGRTARTGVVTQTASCGYGLSTQEFLPWGDPASYYLAPQGDLSSTSNWSLTGVTVADAHDRYSGSAASLVLASNNASAQTPVACVNLQNPTMRFFLTHSGPRSSSALDVYVVYEGLDGHPHTLTLASLTGSDTWQPSPRVLLNLCEILKSHVGRRSHVVAWYRGSPHGSGH